MPKRGRPREHGMTGNPTYQSWTWMKAVCTNVKNRLYRTTGAKGIKFCAKWEKFEGFLEDMKERPEGGSLRRHDTTKDYCPENCYWRIRQEPTHEAS